MNSRCYASDAEIGVDVFRVFLRHFDESPTTDKETKQKERKLLNLLHVFYSRFISWFK